jgi:hypothetical protein
VRRVGKPLRRAGVDEMKEAVLDAYGRVLNV